MSVPNAFKGYSDYVLAGFLTETETETIASLSKDKTVLVWQVPTLDVECEFQVSLDSRSLAVRSDDYKII